MAEVDLKIKPVIRLLLTANLIAGCAAMGPPGGGPEDKTPPEVIGSNPPGGATRVALDTPVEFFFTEPVDPASLEASLFISPSPAEKPRVKTSGNRATISLNGSIAQDQAVIVTLGSGVRDLRGNPLKASISIAFTTGDALPRGAISGKVYSETSAQGMMVGAWRSVGGLPRPDTSAAPYLTQCGADGEFRLEYLQDGEYFVLAWDDRNGDRRYAAGIDRLAIPPRFAIAEADSGISISLFAARRDTLATVPAFVRAEDNRHIVVKLTRPIGREAGGLLADVAISAGDSSEWSILGRWVHPTDSTRIYIATPPQDSMVTYKLTFQGDSASYPVRGGVAPDTTAPTLAAWIPKSGTRESATKPSGWLAFDDRIEAANLAEAVHLMLNDSEAVAIEVRMAGANLVKWEAAEEVGDGAECKLLVQLSSFLDESGNRGADSLWTLPFRTMVPSEYGSIAGAAASRLPGSVIVGAKIVGGGNRSARTVAAGADGAYKLAGLEQGNYVVWAWLDRDDDGLLSPGALDPFEFAEPFSYHPDTLTVRGRWETGGVDISIP